MDVSKYLKRIGYLKTPTVTLACLNELISCQMHAVPFENVDVYYKRSVPSLDEDVLFDKIVHRNRGGYCFELNTLFCAFLCALGFDAVCVRARIRLDRETPPPQTHCAILVKLDGKTWFCDVGFGGTAPIGAVDVSGEVFFYGGHHYRIQESVLYIRRDEEFVPMMEFENQACQTIDFVPMNYFCATSEEEPFVHRLMISLKRPDGYISIDGSVFYKKQSGNGSEILIKDEHHSKIILKEWFGIED